jgi:hypothetical protein
MQPDGMDEATRERAEQFGFPVQKREDGWYLFGELGEEVGPSVEVSQSVKFKRSWTGWRTVQGAVERDRPTL